MTHNPATPNVFRSWTIDSTRWDQFRPRLDDIIIATYPKCGTTWMQRIVDLLVFQSPEPRNMMDQSPWIDMRFGAPLEEMLERVEAQEHRRFLKSHLPFDALPQYEGVRTLHVARDGRDACMSFFNHCSAYTDLAYEAMDRAAEEMGGPAPRSAKDLQTFWHDWLTTGISDEFQDGYPGPSFFEFERGYWEARQSPQLLLIHYSDLLADLDAEMRRIASFLEIEVAEDRWAGLVEAATFSNMKRHGESLLPNAQFIFEGGASRFLFKGSNGRWRDEISADNLALYDATFAARTTQGLGQWIEGGRHGAGDPREASN